MWPMLLMALAGAVKHVGVDKPQENAQRKLAAETQRLSPWTGLKANAPDHASLFNNVWGGGVAGMNMANQMEDQGLKKDLWNALIKKAGGIPGVDMSALSSINAPDVSMSLAGLG